MAEKTAETGYSFGEARVMSAPLVGWPAEDVRHFVIVALDKDQRAGFGASPDIKPEQVPAILRAMAAGIEREVSGG